MKELVKITTQNGQSVVSARELHAFLGVKKDFSNWMKHRINKYGFVEGQDFTKMIARPFGRAIKKGGQNAIEYALTVNCARELAMLEANEKGKQARQYFIACERILQGISQGGKHDHISVGILSNFQNGLDETKQDIAKLTKQVNLLKVISPIRAGYSSIAGYAEENHITLTASQKSDIAQQVVKECKKSNYDILSIPLPSNWYRNFYPEFIVRAVLHKKGILTEKDLINITN